MLVFEEIRHLEIVYAFIVPILMFVLLIWNYYLLARFGENLTKEQTRLFGTPKPRVLHLALLWPEGRDTSPKGMAYRAFYVAQSRDLAKKSILLWIGIYGLSLI